MMAVIGVLSGLLTACEQFAIFDAIALEVEPKPALIEGVASKIVGNSTTGLYVANGRLWQAGPSDHTWNNISAPSDVRDVAVAGSDVYVISVGDSPVLSKLDGGTISGAAGPVQGIYGADNTLYAAIGNDGSYAVYYTIGGTLAKITGVSGLLRGAAFYSGNYYLATSVGLYHSANAATDFTSSIDGNFLGVIAASGKVFAVTRTAIYMVSGGASPEAPKLTGDSFTGALALSGTTLYLGRERGYRTVDTNAATWALEKPETANYESTIALARVTAMYAVGDDLVFASALSSEAKRRGLMSLRGGSWNMEE
jgi:hypothetical protein